ncbi:MAG: DNA polymerase III subunit delta', partial [Desulfobacterales bacterium]|nr:DNA polymerase III subunit delta' [Desulfobacterales bacterium]
LSILVQKEVIPHALLFTGLDGVGKRAAAEQFAMACNCAQPRVERVERVERVDPGKSLEALVCGQCRSCNKIRSGSHPDLISVRPSGSLIRIVQIRDLCGALTLKPFEARIRVVIISDAQAMNPSAANALLKVLEEPPDRTVFILTTEKASDLLPTVISRCRKIRFPPVSRERLAAWLVETEGLDAGDARILSNLAAGSRAKALSMHRKGWITRRRWLLKQAASLGARSMGSRLAFAEKLSRDTGTLPDALEILASWQRDLLVCKVAPGKVINQDVMDDVAAAARGLSAEGPLSIIETIHATRRAIEANGNIRLCLEALTMKIAESATGRRQAV